MKIYNEFELYLKKQLIKYEKEVMVNSILGIEFKHKFRCDYAIYMQSELKCIVECEGGSWTFGRHNQGKGFHNDTLKYNCLQTKIPVFRFTSGMIIKNPVKVVTFIEKFIYGNITTEYLNNFMNEFKLI